MTIPADLAETPTRAAVSMWSRLIGEDSVAGGVVTLKQHAKSQVYRFVVTAYGERVVGKRTHLRTARVERAVYEKVLPHLRIPSLHYYGSVEEEGGEFAWIFMEDAGDFECTASSRMLLARWLAVCHGAGAELAHQNLPPREPIHYLVHLRDGRRRVVDFLGSGFGNAADEEYLRRLVDHCDDLEGCWPRIEALCESVPRTLVHGDLAHKHMRVRGGGAGKHIVVLDWETASWGSPLPDLDKLYLPGERTVDGQMLDVYRTIVGWTIGRSDLERLAATGAVLRILAGIDWASQSLNREGDEQPLWKLRAFESQLSHFRRVLGGAHQ